LFADWKSIKMKEIQASQEHRQRFLFCSPLGTMAKSLIELTIIE
jgi:hypothetical protein